VNWVMRAVVWDDGTITPFSFSREKYHRFRQQMKYVQNFHRQLRDVSKGNQAWSSPQIHRPECIEML
jgi:hypothetical protein